jgi:hypothetical protein
LRLLAALSADVTVAHRSCSISQRVNNLHLPSQFFVIDNTTLLRAPSWTTLYPGDAQFVTLQTQFTQYRSHSPFRIANKNEPSLTTKMVLPHDIDISERSRRFYDGTYTFKDDGFIDGLGGECADRQTDSF